MKFALARKTLWWAGLAVAALALVPLASAARAAAESPAVASARAAGIVGERFDGYLGFVVAPAPALRKQVDAINIRRRALYIDLGNRRGVSPQEVGIAAACQILPRLGVGAAYLLSDGVWRRRATENQRITPEYCG